MTTLRPEAAAYYRTARRRAREAEVCWAERRERALAAARRAAAVIHARYPQARVRMHLFGSTLYPDSFGPHSDVDLAVEGVGWPDDLRLWSQLEALEPEFEIDLVDVAIASPSLRAYIDREGEEL
jgi:predicted nucleotidyltransferase